MYGFFLILQFFIILVGDLLGFFFFLWQITEYQIIEIVENICNLKKEEADWILKIDIVEQGDKLEVMQSFFLGLFLVIILKMWIQLILFL